MTDPTTPIILLDGPMLGSIIRVGEHTVTDTPVVETVVHWYTPDGHFVKTERATWSGGEPRI